MLPDDRLARALRSSAVAVTVVVLFASGRAIAHDIGGVNLDTITVVATGVSNMTAASAGDVDQERILSQPLLRPAAVLENVRDPAFRRRKGQPILHEGR